MQLVAIDVYMPVNPLSLGGGRYIVGFYDCATKYGVVEVLQGRDQVLECAVDTLKRLERESGRALAAVQVDGGRDLHAKALKGWLAAQGVAVRTTAKHTPQQNGAAERFGRTVVEKAHALLSGANLPETLWAEAAFTAALLHNQTALGDGAKSPWELWHGRRPDSSALRVYGCLAYVHFPRQERVASEKFAERAERGVLVGYGQPLGVKGWRVLLADGRVVTACHVRFNENVLPSKSKEELLLDFTVGASVSEGGDGKGGEGGEFGPCLDLCALPPPAAKEQQLGRQGAAGGGCSAAGLFSSPSPSSPPSSPPSHEASAQDDPDFNIDAEDDDQDDDDD